MCADKAKHQPSEKHTLDEVLKTLQDLVRNELADETPAPAPKSLRRAKKDTQPLRDEHTDEATLPSEEAAIADDFKPAPELSPNDFELQPQPARNDAPPEPVDAAQESPGRKKRKSPPPEQTSINWDDVPILNDVVTLPAITHAAVDNAALAAPEKAREIAVKAVAKLNIELRKAGNPTLDPVIIDRLEQLLRDALIAAADPKN